MAAASTGAPLSEIVYRLRADTAGTVKTRPHAWRVCGAATPTPLYRYRYLSSTQLASPTAGPLNNGCSMVRPDTRLRVGGAGPSVEVDAAAEALGAPLATDRKEGSRPAGPAGAASRRRQSAR